ncbi:sporulation protein [Streptomyces sp. CB04723]|uniref:sporulation protein n=1 Tax=Streptomyces sp. CB04723 TaxID=2748873 RepID=UPI00211ACC1E|nr:sporulation protein [Streptomyces sp. CB04723]
MGFKRLLASMGAGGASVETELTEVNVVPGGIVQGEVRIQGGSVAQQIEGLNVGLQARVEVESGDQETKQDIEFTSRTSAAPSRCRPRGARGAVRPEIPWETPITMFGGQHLRGMNIGVTTELEIARALDSGDLDPINVHPASRRRRS